MPTLNTGASIDVAVPSGSSIAVRAYEDATVNVLIPLGQPGGPSSTVSGTGKSFGPFSVNSTVRLFVVRGVAEYEVNGTSADTSGAGFAPAKSALIAAYEAQQALDAQNGPMLLARAGLPVAGDVPTITASATDPSADADPATQLIYPFGNIGNIDPIPQSALERKQWYRGHSVGLRARQINTDMIRLAETCGTYGNIGSQDSDPLLGYGIDAATVVLSLNLDSDVFFMRTQGNSACTFSMFVNGSRVTAAPGGGITQLGTDRYHPTAKYVKLKWSSVGRRKVQIVFTGLQCPSILYTRAVSTILPVSQRPLTWLHFGDSFSQYTGASQRELSLSTWMHAAFGLEFDFVNVAQGGTGFAPGNRPGIAPVAATKASIRNQYALHASKLHPAVVTYLVGHNDATESAMVAASELTALLQQVAADNPGVVQCVFTTNASRGITVNGNDVVIEAALLDAARSVPGVLVVPLQTAQTGAFLRGTGRVGAPTGVGNTDLYTGPDDTHPSDAGHRAYGQHMGSQLYAAVLAS